MIGGLDLVLDRVRQRALGEIARVAVLRRPIAEGGAEAVRGRDAPRLAARGLVVAQELGEHHVAEHQPAHRGEDKIGLRMLRPLRRQNFERALRERDAVATLAFIRLAGTVQTRASKSTSAHVTARASPERAAVRITNSRSARDTL